jgi:hypothetical protein
VLASPGCRACSKPSQRFAIFSQNSRSFLLLDRTAESLHCLICASKKSVVSSIAFTTTERPLDASANKTFDCCYLFRFFDLAQIVRRPTDRNLFYKSSHARPSLPAALVRRGNKGSATPRNLLHCKTIGFSNFPGSGKICLTPLSWMRLRFALPFSNKLIFSFFAFNFRAARRSLAGRCLPPEHRRVR